MNSNDLISYLNKNVDSRSEIDSEDLKVSSSQLSLQTLMSSPTQSSPSTTTLTSTLTLPSCSQIKKLECSHCKSELSSGFVCKTCTNYSLCNDCFKLNLDHEHKLESLSDLDKDKPDNQITNSHLITNVETEPESQSKKNQTLVDTCLKALNHSVGCHENNCRFEKCSQIKRIIQHSINCQEIKNGTHCDFCRQLIALCIYHAKSCQEEICQVPYCNPIKLKLSKMQEFKVKLQSITEFIQSNIKLLKYKVKNDSQTQTDSDLMDKQDIQIDNNQDETETNRKLFIEKLEKLKSTNNSANTNASTNTNITSREDKVYKFDKKIRNQLVKNLIDIIVDNYNLKTQKIYDNSNFGSFVVYFIKREKDLYNKTANSDDYLCLLTELFYNIELEFEKKIVLKRKADSDTQINFDNLEDVTTTDTKEPEDRDADLNIPPRKKTKFE